MKNKYVLCRPQGGFNDMLSQIEKCYVYAKKENRTVIVDASYSANETWHDSLDRYFTSIDESLILNISSISESIESMTVYPESLFGRLNTYKGKFDREKIKRCDVETGEILSFNFNKSYPHQLLLHHQAGGSSKAINALTRLKLNKSLVEELFKRLKIIGGRYTGVHVRNTDYQTNYHGILNKLEKSNIKRLFLATDSATVFNDFLSSNFKGKIYNFTSRLSTDGRPIHKRVDSKDVYDRNVDCVLDVLLLALANRLHVLRIKKTRFSNQSGYSILARNLSRNKAVLKRFIGDSRVKISVFDLIKSFIIQQVGGNKTLLSAVRRLRKGRFYFSQIPADKKRR
jgi:hypothetical protein